MKKINDSWFTVESIDEKTFAISEYGHWEKVHSYLLLGTERAALIDTGLGIDNIKRITDQLTNLPIIVITTHVHWDHIGSHQEFGTIVVHHEEASWLEEGIKGLSIDQIRKDVARDITKQPPVTFNPSTYTPYQGKASEVVSDGDLIDLGERILTILHTPGHSPGHICVLDNTYNYLFTGDLLYTGTPIYAHYPTTSPENLVHSLEKISYLEGLQRIFGSHNELGMDPSILLEVMEAVYTLRNKDVIRHGTGIHKFQTISIQF
ncbi:MBL fold metallo-hydrolase [Ornithinibacillus halophilus]|uniref:Glyoxylase, beta-lactamase superfamily II n=1 Tax=Ornithinibacillus halophilus TaxID=930117 RepID=A0A1M5JX63_9BACI|nr:MBL fold metallo-hydrolase [Ornithinibacillus halophilus]SHG44900.1 Glyoxylase, beta-lactamase superfamily II [Ornithinibacillus halophilus]